jgi:hypothetical protein
MVIARRGVIERDLPRPTLSQDNKACMNPGCESKPHILQPRRCAVRIQQCVRRRTAESRRVVHSSMCVTIKNQALQQVPSKGL